jgi:hypothetical protein
MVILNKFKLRITKMDRVKLFFKEVYKSVEKTRKNFKLFFKDLQRQMASLKKISAYSVFFDSKIREDLRESFKNNFIFISSFINWIKFFDFHYISDSIFYYFCKYVGVFFFVLWILFESFFLRFYLVDTPLDAKMFQDRKENTSNKRRFIPIIGFEALSFYIRPFYRVFNTATLFMSNLSVLVWLIYYVYILDLLRLFSFILAFFARIFFLTLVFFVLIFDSILFIYRRYFHPVLLLFFNRFLYKLSKFYGFCCYCFNLPLLLSNHFLRFILVGFPKILYFISIVKITELKIIYKHFLKHKTFPINGDFYDKAFYILDFIGVFVFYSEGKLLEKPKKFIRYFILLNKFYNWLSASFVVRFLKFVYCFFFFFFLWLIFLLLIYFPFIF